METTNISGKSVLAYGSVPKDAGTFTFYRSLRAGLLAEGFDIRCVSVGAQQAAGWDPEFADDGCVLLGAELHVLRDQARCFADWCARENVRFVMPVNSPALRAALPHLPGDVRLIPRCADSAEFGYQRALTCRGRIATIVATTPRHVKDLEIRYRVPPEQIILIPHGISQEPYDALPAPGTTRKPGMPLRLAFLGRLEHHDKGILFLPAILRRLRQEGVPWKLSVAGKGQHEAELRAGLKRAGFADSVQFVGALNSSEVPPFLVAHDVLLFPSRHEGFGFVLIEALMAGCVPVASRLDGVTDFIIRHGETGQLCPVGDTAAFASAVAGLGRDADVLARCESAARADARERFTDRHMTTAYATLLREWNDRPAPSFNPIPWALFQVPCDLRNPIIRRWLRSLKRRFWRIKV